MSLKYEKKDIYSTLSQEELDNANSYAKSYMNFLDRARTEYLAVEEAIKILENNGFISLEEKQILEVGDRIYFVNKDKSLYVAVIGRESIVNGINVVGAHIDSPRLDLKPMPLIEKSGAALLKTQYYGGIKKYQWMSIPLAMYGVMYNKNGEKIKISIGENEDDPVFTIADLLPHLAKDQMKLNANDFIVNMYNILDSPFTLRGTKYDFPIIKFLLSFNFILTNQLTYSKIQLKLLRNRMLK